MVCTQIGNIATLALLRMTNHLTSWQDASHNRYGFEYTFAPGWADDRDAAEASLTALRTFTAQHRHNRAVGAGHPG